MIFSRQKQRQDLYCIMLAPAVIAGRREMVRLCSGRFDWTVQVEYPPPLTESGVRRRAQEKAFWITLELRQQKIAEAKLRRRSWGWMSPLAWGSREQVNKSKSLSRRNTTEANRSWQDTRWKACFGTLLYLDHNNVLGIRTCVLLTSRHLARAGSLRTTCWNSSQCQRLSRALENMAQIADHPSRASPRPHAHSLDQHSLGEKWDLKAIAD